MCVALVVIPLYRFNRRLRDEIQERQEVEAHLRKSEDMMRSIFRAAPTGIGVVGDRVFMEVNRRLCEMTGYSKEELIGQNASMLYPTSDEYQYVGQEKYRQISEMGTGAVETRFQKKNGSTIDILLASTPIDANDLSRGVTFTALDITDRKRAELRLVDASKRLTRILDSIPADIYVSDIDTYEILYMNEYMKNSFGKDLTGRICWEVFREGDKPCEHCTNQTLINENRQPTGIKVWEGMNPVNGKYYLNHDLAMHWIDDRLARIQIAIDITENKRAEAAIWESLSEKETLLQEIHHRVKNNMAVIGSLLKLQSGNISDPDIRNVLRESQNRVYAMAAVHETLYQSESMACIDTKAYLAKISSALFQVYSVHSGRVSLEIESDDIELNADKASYLGLVINELLSNSLKYAFPDDRTGEIAVKLRNSNGGLVITVADDGVGIPEEVDWMKTSTLGFQLVRTLVEDQLEGSITWRDNPGTTFTIRIDNPV